MGKQADCYCSLSYRVWFYLLAWENVRPHITDSEVAFSLIGSDKQIDSGV